MTDFNQPTRLVIFAYGNPSRGDDALAPELLQQLQQVTLRTANIEFIEDFQLQIDHALDLENRDLALFIDASMACSPPFGFSRLCAARDTSHTSHAMHPAAILQVYQEIKHQPAPPAFLLSVRGESFELGDPLGKSAQANLQAAFTFLKTLCSDTSITAWENLAQTANQA